MSEAVFFVNFDRLVSRLINEEIKSWMFRSLFYDCIDS